VGGANGHEVSKITMKSQQRFYEIVCPQGHSYSKRSTGVTHGCPECNKKFLVGESRVRAIFETVYGKPFTKEKLAILKHEKTGRLLELDGFNKELNIAFEFQGRQHETSNSEFGKDFENQKIRDKEKVELCKKNGIKLVVVDQPKRYDFSSFIKEAMSDIKSQITTFADYSEKLEQKIEEKFSSYIPDQTDAQKERLAFIHSKGYKLCAGEMLTGSSPIVVSCQQPGCDDVHTTFEGFRQHYGAAYKSSNVVSEPCKKCKLEKNNGARLKRTHEDFVKSLKVAGWIFDDNKEFKNQNEVYTAKCVNHPNVSVSAVGRSFIKKTVSCDACKAGIDSSVENMSKEVKARKMRTHDEFVKDIAAHGWILNPGQNFEKLNTSYEATCASHPEVSVSGFGGNFIKNKVACHECRKEEQKKALEISKSKSPKM
jgi:hypothetical protein